MKMQFLLAAALFAGAATAASAQTTPTGTPQTGTMNQTTPALPNPATTGTTTGTLDQRPATTTNSTDPQMRTDMGKMDRTPAVENQATMDAERRTNTTTTTTPRRSKTMRKANAPRSTNPIK